MALWASVEMLLHTALLPIVRDRTRVAATTGSLTAPPIRLAGDEGARSHGTASVRCV